MRSLLPIAWLLAAIPAVALAADETTTTEKKFDPSEEWTLHAWIPIHIGPLDMSINKAVVYLLLGALLSCLLGIFVMRVKTGKDPDRKQALGEIIYEIARVQVAEQGLPMKAMRTWFPYCASLMIFIWVVNMLGFIPLPLSDEKVDIGGVELPTLAIFAATSTLSVTLALALMTWVFTHVEGIRANGVMKYLQS
jgi:F-type H+-transporting ATPase subunit a